MENEVLVRFYRAYSREIYLYLYGLSNNRQPIICLNGR